MIAACTKKAFTKKEAQSVLNNHQANKGRKSARSRKEQRMYQCDACDMWHLTSMDEAVYELIREQKQNSVTPVQVGLEVKKYVRQAIDSKQTDILIRIEELENQFQQYRQKKGWFKRWFKL
jgi:hypothetical protein